MMQYLRTTRGIVAMVVVVTALGGAAGGVYWWRASSDKLPDGGDPAPTPKDFPLPGYSKSPYLNTGPDAQYIGSAACAVCHKAKHESYLQTAHSRALSDVDESAEPPDGAFEHKASGRSYRVYRKDQQMRHEETVRSEDGKEIARVDLPVRYLVGSGSFSRTYLVEIDGFLYESPITHYTASKRWWVSPGYDSAMGNLGFERPITAGCMFCHAGRIEAEPGVVNRLSFPEKAIGCENCHGPGSLHQDLQRSKKLQPGEDDWTIVHPGKLSRSLQEDLCANCHLHGLVSIPVRGRKDTDFRPGKPLADYRIHYQFDSGSDQMSVVGHVEQLRMSACYQKSNMTCLTCHDPHRRTQPKDLGSYYQKKCMNCHAQGNGTECKLEKPERLKKEPADNCVACHMPRGDTDIPHIAFVHHRITRQPRAKKEGAPERPYNLVPMEDIKHLPAIDQDRNLGLAYMEAARQPECAPFSGAYVEKGRFFLERVQEAGLKDAATAKALLEYYVGSQPMRASALARQILDMKDAPPAARRNALLCLATADMRARNFPSAIQRLEEMNKLLRNAEQWRMLGGSYLHMNQTANALPPFKEALSLRPYSPEIHEDLAEAYRRAGKSELVQEHLHKARWLRQREK
jgi:predicted CXXCH cytochrome family protein